MGWKVNVGLLVVVAGMGSYLYLKDPPDPNLGPSVLQEPLFSRSVWDAREIRFQYSKDRVPIRISMNAQAGEFRLEDPVADVASYAMLKSVLDAYQGAMLLVAHSAEDVEDEPEILERTGLLEPVGSFEARFSADDRELVEFGKLGFRDDEIYARVRGQIHRVALVLHNVLEKNADDLRENRLFSELDIGDTFSSVRLEERIDNDEIQVRAIELDRMRGYRIVEPAPRRANQERVAIYLNELRSLTVGRFLSGAAQQLGPAQDWKYRLEVTGNGVEVLELTEAQGGFVGHLRRRNIKFELDSLPVGRLLQWSDLLRATHLLTLRERDIHRIEIDGGVGHRPVVLERGALGAAFRLEQPVLSVQVNPTPVNRLLYALTNLKVEEYVDSPTEGTGLEDGEGFFTVRVSTAETGQEAVVIRLGNTSEDRVYVRREDDDTPVLLDASLRTALTRPWTEFVSRYLPEMRQVPFRLEVTVPGRDEPIVYIDDENGWHEVGSEEENLDVFELADGLRKYRASDVIPESDLAPGIEPVRLLFRRDTQATSGEFFAVLLTEHGEDAVLKVENFVEGAVFLVPNSGQPSVFRRLLDLWRGR